LDERLGGPIWTLWRIETSLATARNETTIPGGHAACSVVAVPNELHWASASSFVTCASFESAGRNVDMNRRKFQKLYAAGNYNMVETRKSEVEVTVTTL
jgi:hypothetical protein